MTATQRPRRDPGAPPVLVLTTVDDDEVLAAALRAGAAGFALKGAPAGEPTAGRPPRRCRRGVARPGRHRRVLTTDARADAAPGRRLAGLTAREREVLERIGRGLTNAEIAAEFVLGEGTVKTHVNHVFAKLQLRDRAAAVVFAFDSGLVRPGER